MTLSARIGNAVVINRADRVVRPYRTIPKSALRLTAPLHKGGKGWRKEEQKMRLREQSHFLSYSGDNQSSNTG